MQVMRVHKCQNTLDTHPGNKPDCKNWNMTWPNLETSLSVSFMCSMTEQE